MFCCLFSRIEGFKEAAEKFQAEAGVEPSVPLNSLDNRILIREAVQSGRIQEATHLVNKLHPWLLDNDRYLYFHLQQLHLIELIRLNELIFVFFPTFNNYYFSIIFFASLFCRSGKIEEALSFAQTQMSEAGEKSAEVRTELERTLALLAFEKPQNSPFADLLEQSHRQKVASELNAAILKTQHCENTSPRIINLLKMILWAQNELDKKNITYPKMTELATATIEQKNVEYI